MSITAGIIEAERYYAEALRVLVRSHLPFMIGGAYALRVYAGIVRHTKDLDIFCAPADSRRIARTLVRSADRVEQTNPTWLTKVYRGDLFIDIIHGAGNGIARVDRAWFEHARPARLLGSQVKLIPPEEMLWSKMFVQDRYRFDGADVAHIIRRQARTLDWQRLLDRAGPDWEVLLAHLINTRFIYPGERENVPDWVLHELLARLEREHLGVLEPPREPKVCRGTLFTPYDYVADVTAWGYADARADVPRRRARRRTVHAHRRAG